MERVDIEQALEAHNALAIGVDLFGGNTDERYEQDVDFIYNLVNNNPELKRLLAFREAMKQECRAEKENPCAGVYNICAAVDRATNAMEAVR